MKKYYGITIWAEIPLEWLLSKFRAYFMLWTINGIEYNQNFSWVQESEHWVNAQTNQPSEQKDFNKLSTDKNKKFCRTSLSDSN